MACNGNCNCTCEKDKELGWSSILTSDNLIWDESGYPVGETSPSVSKYFLKDENPSSISYKYAEDKILADLKAHLDKTYSEHYATKNNIECFDAWIALGDSTPTFRNTAIKYLWRYGKKNGNNKKDLLKALHYIFMCLYVDHYKDEK